MSDLDDVHAGYLPLLDGAVLVTAARLGFAEYHGIRLHLHREMSWATIRDRMGVGHFDCAHMLAPMAIAASLNLGPLSAPVVAPMVLALGGNAVTVSPLLAELMTETGWRGEGPAAAGMALADALARLERSASRRGRFAVVHAHSCHNYDLRYWLAACGIEPDRDVDITVVPPPLMPDAIASGQIDGFCVGEPWSTIAVRRGAGRIVTTKAEIWRRSPEKVLGVSARFAAERPKVLDRLIRALHGAAVWCDASEHHAELADLLADAGHIGVAPRDLVPALTGLLEVAPGEAQGIEDFMIFADGAANRPRLSDGFWMLSQMVRWRQVTESDAARHAVRTVFRPDLYDRALSLEPSDSAIENVMLNDQDHWPEGLFDRSE
ncbi:MAG: ABC transporter substrate-binding protein [Fulvimarina manganoxydans]|uniref:CmpA/NrtA family ABC transporter substrate-binding protein n=1 Tax=Fulvimarina manganoxydans TaxID=937218 RepID=UPI002356FF0C|nr:CmpA/NrtA family ABC transporter substrate-binding protein [Fulvimarina manganoxydans]MCK5933270.1 ABC transporter substrate-binding protein [Fulvimarina manganoxydans]